MYSSHDTQRREKPPVQINGKFGPPSTAHERCYRRIPLVCHVIGRLYYYCLRRWPGHALTMAEAWRAPRHTNSCGGMWLLSERASYKRLRQAGMEVSRSLITFCLQLLSSNTSLPPPSPPPARRPVSHNLRHLLQPAFPSSRTLLHSRPSRSPYHILASFITWMCLTWSSGVTAYDSAV